MKVKCTIILTKCGNFKKFSCRDGGCLQEGGVGVQILVGHLLVAGLAGLSLCPFELDKMNRRETTRWRKDSHEPTFIATLSVTRNVSFVWVKWANQACAVLPALRFRGLPDKRLGVGTEGGTWVENEASEELNARWGSLSEEDSCRASWRTHTWVPLYPQEMEKETWIGHTWKSWFVPLHGCITPSGFRMIDKLLTFKFLSPTMSYKPWLLSVLSSTPFLLPGAVPGTQPVLSMFQEYILNKWTNEAVSPLVPTCSLDFIFLPSTHYIWHIIYLLMHLVTVYLPYRM